MSRDQIPHFLLTDSIDRDAWRQNKQATAQVIDLLRRCPLLQDMNKSILSLIASQESTDIDYFLPEQNRTLYAEGHTAKYMHFLIDGIASVKGSQGWTTLRHPGQQAGLTLLLSGEAAEATCKPLTPCATIRISNPTLKLILRLRTGTLVKAICRGHAQRNRVLQHRIAIGRTRNLDNRMFGSFVAQLYWANQQYRIFSGGQTLSLNFSRKAVVDLLDLESTNKLDAVMKSLKTSIPATFDWPTNGYLKLKADSEGQFGEHFLKDGYGTL